MTNTEIPTNQESQSMGDLSKTSYFTALSISAIYARDNQRAKFNSEFAQELLKDSETPT